jgi:hypothetical protein
MIRQVASIVVALTISPSLLYAQETVLTVTVPSADVYRGPTNVTPVIGHVPEGTAVPIVRNLGSWVKIAWPGGLDNFGYLHVTMGRIGPMTGDVRAASASSSPQPRTASTIVPITQTSTPAGTTGQPTRSPVAARPAPRVQGTAAPASHNVGVGATVGSAKSFGGTVRAWTANRIGIQFSVTRDTLNSDLTSDTLTTTQFDPGVMFGLCDRITDYVWLRPYVGSTVSFRRVTANALVPVSETTRGVRVFGGAEFMFASAPQFGISADLGYQRFSDSIPGFEVPRMSVAVAGHWYVR